MKLARILLSSLNVTLYNERLQDSLQRLCGTLFTRLVERAPHISEGKVMTLGPPPYRRLDCDGRALAYVRVRPRKRAVRVELSGLWMAPYTPVIAIPSYTGATLMVQSEQDIEEALVFIMKTVEYTRKAYRGELGSPKAQGRTDSTAA